MHQAPLSSPRPGRLPRAAALGPGDAERTGNGDRASAHGQASTSGRDTAAPVQPTLPGRPWVGARTFADASTALVQPPRGPAPTPRGGLTPVHDGRLLATGAAAALAAHTAMRWAAHLPPAQRLLRRFVWWRGDSAPGGAPPLFGGGSQAEPRSTALVLYQENAEAVEWVNMCWRKAWRVYQRGLERWLADLLQPVFDSLVDDGQVPRFVQRLRILEFTLDHEAPYFSNMRRRTSRKDSDLNGVVDVRYTGGARMLLLIEVGQGRWRVKVPVLVSDLDLECKMWIKLRLAPMCPYIGTLSLAFVGEPTIKVQLLPYNRVRLMRIPILQAYLTKLFTIDLPGLMVLPRRLEINIPPAVTAVAEAAVGRDAVMRAVATAVLQADALENALAAALPLGPQSAAGGISLPDSFTGELAVTLLEARDLPVWGFPWQSNPYCRLTLGSQAVRSRRDDATSHAGSHRAPVWNQEFQLLVEDPGAQVLSISIRDSHMTGRPDVGRVTFPLSRVPADGALTVWLPVQPPVPGTKAEGELKLQLVYKPFEDDDEDSGYREARLFSAVAAAPSADGAIVDVKSAADASSRAAVAASAAAAAVAVTKAAAARAATKAARAAKAAAARRLSGSSDGGGAPPVNGAAPPGDGAAALVNGAATPLNSVPRPNGAVAADGVLAQASLDGLLAASEEASRLADDAATADGGPPPPPDTGSSAWTPEDLFPAVAFRIAEDADEDMPYTYADGSERAAKKPRRKAITARPASDAERTRAIEAAAAAAEAAAAAGAPLPTVLSVATAPPEGDDAIDAALGHIADAGTDDDEGDLDGEALLAVLAPAASGELDGGEASFVGHADEPLTPRRPPLELPAARSDAALEGTAESTASDGASPSEPKEVDDEAGKEGGGGGLEGGTTTKEGGGGGVLATAGGALAAAGAWTTGAASAAASWATGAGAGVAGWWADRRKAAEAKRDQAEAADPRAVRARRDAERRARDAAEGRDPVESVVVPADLPLEAIAEEVKNSWKLKEVHAETMLQRAMAKSEKPWLIALTLLSAASALLLAAVFWKLHDMG